MSLRYFIIAFKTGRWGLSFATALAAVSGALLKYPDWNAQNTRIFLGAILFALACTWFNQIQERQKDRNMYRTKNRPLARNVLPVRHALIWANLCLLTSAVLLFSCEGGWPAITIMFLVPLLYNGLYTLLKERSIFALIPGATAGALPPVLGWVCAGGSIQSRIPLMLFFLFFLWQVPHFWIVAYLNRQDYENAGLPLPWSTFGERIYNQLLALWITAFCVLLLALPAFGFVQSASLQCAVVCIVVCLFVGLFGSVMRRPPNHLFYFINLSMAAVCVILVAERIYRGY